MYRACPEWIHFSLLAACVSRPSPPLPQGTHKSLKGNSHALSTVTAIIDGTGSVGMQRTLSLSLSPRALWGEGGKLLFLTNQCPRL